MYQAVFSSIAEQAKSTLSALQDLNFHEDGPSLVFYILLNLFTVTLSNSQARWDKLSDFH